MKQYRLKTVVIREELFALTQDTFEAIILGQMLYWSERIDDVDDFILEEQERRKGNAEELNIEPQNGWIYKSAQQLKDECMLNLSISTVRRYLQKLIDKGYLSERNNPNNKWDRILQYHVNLNFIISEIQKLGYDGLSGYKSSKVRKEFSNRQNENSDVENDDAIPKTTIETITNNKEDKSSLKKDGNVGGSVEKDWRNDFDVYVSMVDDAKKELANDVEFFNQMNKYFSYADYYKTLDKMVEMYWGTEIGWENKKKKRSKTINMVSTLKNNFQKNIVYLPKGQTNIFKGSNVDSQKNNKNNGTIWQS